jgi:hypothetical protein
MIFLLLPVGELHLIEDHYSLHDHPAHKPQTIPAHTAQTPHDPPPDPDSNPYSVSVAETESAEEDSPPPSTLTPEQDNSAIFLNQQDQGRKQREPSRESGREATAGEGGGSGTQDEERGEVFVNMQQRERQLREMREALERLQKELTGEQVIFLCY